MSVWKELIAEERAAEVEFEKEQREIKKAMQGRMCPRIDGFTELGIANLPEAVRKLRRHDIPVEMEMVSGTNRYGESVRYGEYSIPRRR